ncbi:MAG TPA: hypothetical protein VFB66_22785 [Tepidisphaeraceae bacterium]|nr:hypothetical protein [Tepidisphaeraceae bacterium]
MKRGTVIDEKKYSTALREVARILKSRPRERVDERLTAAFGAMVVRQSSHINPEACRGLKGGRLAVAAGQYLIWHFHGHQSPKPAGERADSFSGVFALYWSLLKRKLQLDLETAVDLVRLDRAGRGDTEPRHALVKLLERNFSPPVGDPLASMLREWGDELAVHDRAIFRKLATRVYALSGS